MIKLNKKKASDHSEARNKVARSVAAGIVKAQQVWASWMNRQSQKCPPKIRGAIMIIFLMSMAAISISMIIRGGEKGKRVIAKAGIITIPVLTPSGSNKPIAGTTDAAVKRIKRYRKYLDSLAATQSGKIKLDSIIRIRPGLQDSLRMVERLYK